jgi:hypothetical protein
MLALPPLQSNPPGFAEPAQAYFENIRKIGVKGQFQMHCLGLCSVIDHVYVFMKANVHITVANDAYGGGRKVPGTLWSNVKTGHGMLEQVCPNCIGVLPLYRQAEGRKETSIGSIQASGSSGMYVPIAA